MLSFDALRLPAALRRDITGALAARFPQTVLIAGPEEGAHALGLTLAAALLCEHGAPCGACLSCHKVETGIHPDLIVVDEEGEIKIETARQIRREASILPNDGTRKVFLIGHAERMNVPSQNALLKVLEEPPRYCFFILLTTQPDRILETILSRCTRYQLPPDEEAPDESLLPKLAPYLRALAEGSEIGLMRAAVGLEKLTRPQMKAWLALLQTALRDAVFAGERLGAPLLPAVSDETRAIAGRLTTERLTALYELCAVLIGRVELNAASSAMTNALTADVYTAAFLSKS